MKGFLKEHFVLIIGISLPLILSLVFFASANFRFETIPPPQYPVVFAQDFYYRNNPEYPYKLAVNEEKTLELRYTPSSAENAANWQVPQIYLYDPKTKRVERIDLPEITPGEKSTQPVAALKTRKVDTALTSPDGFTFRSEYRGSGNLMTEVFGGGHSGRNRIVLSKDGVDFPIKVEAPYYYGQGELIGWVVEE
ncbi:MAG: hypothetical protein KA099_02550 [Alphaproteobacteria bacterium]|nr:hypothetical protein [Alphaproteobacteria bacterium]MBP7762242.1 hypothetical protein [Alphaproteobacteria bacterium]MBP7904181.1 hypothetical protein [Alphaproteobacteria bacterium]